MRSCVLSLPIVLAGLTGLGPVSHASANERNDYSELLGAITDGKDVRMTLDLSKCLVRGTDKQGPLVRGSLSFEGYMIQPDQTIAFSTTHFTVRSDGTPVNEFLSFKIDPTGKVAAHTRFLNPQTYAIFHEAEFDCKIGEGIAFHW